MGHPRLDIIRYCPKDERVGDNRIRIGLVGHFNRINSINGKSAICGSFSDSTTEDLIFQVTLLSSYVKIIEKLDPNKYAIAIRPYPLESIEQYLNAKKIQEGKISLDKSLEFGIWACQQDLIIGPTSSTLSQIAVAKRPFINMDALNNRSMEAYKDSIRDVFIREVANHCPKTYEELFNMIENHKEFSITSSGFDNVLDDVYNIHKPGSCLWAVAGDIVRNLKLSSPKVKCKLPKKFIQLIEQLRFKEKSTSYGHFLFNHLKNKLEHELGPVAKNCIDDMSSYSKKFLV